MTKIIFDENAVAKVERAIARNTLIQCAWFRDGCACLLGTLADSQYDGDDVIDEFLERGLSMGAIDKITDCFDSLPQGEIEDFARRFARVAACAVDYEEAIRVANSTEVPLIDALERQLGDCQ